MTDFSKELEFALDISSRIGEIALRYWEDIKPDIKADGSPVTIADKESERLVREAITTSFPLDDILGEEEGVSYGNQTGKTSRKWIIDPIDGTYNYIRGIPFFSSLLALEQDGEVVLGVIHAPAMRDTFWAAKGLGAYKNGHAIRVSNCKKLGEAQFNFGELNRIFAEKFTKGFTEIVNKTYRHRGFGDYLSFSYVFEGKSEAALEVGVHAWDLAPVKIIIEEAGGCYSDLRGGTSIYTGSCLISNGFVHEALLNMLLQH